jgi:hypothetical protein
MLNKTAVKRGSGKEGHEDEGNKARDQLNLSSGALRLTRPHLMRLSRY